MTLAITRADWADRIAASWRQGAASIIDAGRHLTEAKASLEFGDFEAMIESDLPFTPRTAQMLMAIARDPRLTNPKRVSLLPPHWGTLYELSKLPDEALEKGFSEGTIGPDTERSAVVAVRKAIRQAPANAAYAERVANGCTVDDLHALADSGAEFATLMADPNWEYETWSEKGKDRSPDQHYKTGPIDPIKNLPVGKLAAKNSALHLWCMDWQLPGAIEVIDAWDFKLINVGFVWVKQNPSGVGNFMGLGHWTRNGAELCLLATKGHPIRRSASVRQVIEAPVGKHSEKPDAIYERVEALTGGPYLELFARKERPGWVTWGDEIASANFANMIAADADGVIADEPPAAGERTEPGSHRPLQPVTQNNIDTDDFPEGLRRNPDNSFVVSPRSSQSDSAGDTR